jgi:hypothetical protein
MSGDSENSDPTGRICSIFPYIAAAYRYQIQKSSVAQPHYFCAVPAQAPGKNFDAAPVHTQQIFFLLTRNLRLFFH